MRMTFIMFIIGSVILLVGTALQYLLFLCQIFGQYIFTTYRSGISSINPNFILL